MKSTKLIRVYSELVIAAVCPECHFIQTIHDQMVLFYFCTKCKKPFLPYKTPFTAFERCKHENYTYRNHGYNKVCKDCGKWQCNTDGRWYK
jgi:hypothetical protein